MLRFAQHDRKGRTQNDMGWIVILNPSNVILSEAKDLTLLRVNSVKDLSQNDPLPSLAKRRL